MRLTPVLLLALIAVSLVTWGPIAEVAAQKELDAFQLAAGEGVVVLKNGRTVRGSVTRLGDQLLIQLAAGGEIRVPVTQSLVIAESLEEAYEIRRDGLLPAAVDDRAKLVDWCMQEDLLHRAADQILALSKIDPRHPALPQLERRLQARAKASAPSQAIPRSTAPEALGSIAPATAFAAEPTVDPRNFFVEKVQAQVVFGCAAARCHGGPAGRDFRLRSYPIAVRPVDEITDANFAAVRKFLGDGSPHNPAIRNATRAHAGPSGDKVRDLLISLAQALSDGSGASASTADFSSATSPATSIGGSGVHTAGFAEGAASRPAETNPYDPAEFNRRHHGKVELPATP